MSGNGTGWPSMYAAAMSAPLELSRPQILGFRRRVGALDERLPPGRSRFARRPGRACRTACRGPRCSRSTRGSTAPSPAIWEDPSLVQLWGPRYQLYVVAARDLPVFSLGRLPDDAKGRQRAEDLAERLHALLDGRTMTYGEAGQADRRQPERAAIRAARRARS